MIPGQIYVEGFLCYRDPQRACFDGCSLWLLAGPNGTGKSALFDAVTYSLYGQHRAGRHNARGLINKSRDGFVVAFDFRSGNHRFRARRTLSRRVRATRQLYQWTETEPEDGWLPIPDTHSEQGFNRWIESNLGLSYETFTASVLLLQGRADSLLQVGPAERHDLLSQIVGLERYEELQQRAKRHHSRAHGALAKLRDQLQKIPKISARQLELARNTVTSATRRHEVSAARVQRLHGGLEQAEQWRQLRTSKLELERKISDLSELLKDEPAIRASYDRWRLLASRVECLTVLEQSHRDETSGRKSIDALEKERKELERRLAELDVEIGRSSTALDEAERELESAGSLANDLAGRQSLIVQSILPRERLQIARRQAVRASESIRERQERLVKTSELRQRVAVEVPSDRDERIASSRLADATNRVARSDALLQEVQHRYTRLCGASKGGLCGYCQQPLPEAHVVAERKKLLSRLDDAREALEQARRELDDARAAAAKTEEKKERISRELHALDCRVSELNAELGTLREQRAEAESCREQTLEALPGSVRIQFMAEEVDAVSGTTVATDIRSLESEGRELTIRMQEARGRMARAGESVARLRAKQDSDMGRRQSIGQQMQHIAERIARHRGELEQVRKAAAVSQRSLSELLPDPTRASPADQARRLRLEHDSLAASEISNRYNRLQEAHLEIERLAGRLAAVRDQIERIPETARGTPIEIEKLMQESRESCEAADLEIRESVSKRARLEETSRQRDSLSNDFNRTDRQQYLWNRLATLLGRDGLLRHLIRDTERAIVDYANAILDRLAAGQMYLELRTNDSVPAHPAVEKALDLVVRTATSDGEPQEVAFLSGSQKFRVAVSLSLAIGQYASQARRPVQAVIIDEGFGCLDNVNRQVMIQELHNLKNYLERVVIVSHQEEFAAAFPDGYRSELVDGTARLTPFHG